MAGSADKSFSSESMDGPRALRSSEHASAIRLLDTVLRPNGPPSILKEYPLALGKQNADSMRVITKGDEVVSHAAVYFSRLRSGDLVFNVGGIGSVATHLAYQGRGLASAVMRDCIDVMRHAECHLSVLWSQRYDFYRNLGYESAGSEYLYQVRRDEATRIPGGCPVVRYAPHYLSEIVELHNRETHRTERTAQEWNAYLGIPKTNVLLAVRGKRVSAYAIMGKGEDFRNCILEWGGDARDLLGLVREFSASAGDIMILVPAQESSFTRLLDHYNFSKVFEYLALMRVIDVDGLSSVIRDYMRKRLGGEFHMTGNEHGVRITLKGEETALKDERSLVRVLFGPDRPSSLLRGLSGETAAALDRALPIPLFIWGLDSV